MLGRLRLHTLHVGTPVVKHVVGVDTGNNVAGGGKQFLQKVHQEYFLLQNTPAFVFGVEGGLVRFAIKDGGLGVVQAGVDLPGVSLDFLLQVAEPFLVELAVLGAGRFGIVVRQQRPEGIVDFFVVAVAHAAVESAVL